MKNLKQFILESKYELFEVLQDIIYDENFQEDNYSIFDEVGDEDDELRIKLIDGFCLEV